MRELRTPSPRRPRLRHLLVALAPIAALACGDDDGTGPGGGVAGSYTIVQVNDDRTAPFTVFEGTEQGISYRFEIVSGTLTLRGDGDYTSVGTARLTFNGQSGGNETSSQTGRYTVSGSTVTFDPAGNDPDEPTYTATYADGALTLTQTEEGPTGAPVTITVVARR